MILSCGNAWYIHDDDDVMLESVGTLMCSCTDARMTALHTDAPQLVLWVQGISKAHAGLPHGGLSTTRCSTEGMHECRFTHVCRFTQCMHIHTCAHLRVHVYIDLHAGRESEHNVCLMSDDLWWLTVVPCSRSGASRPSICWDGASFRSTR